MPSSVKEWNARLGYPASRSVQKVTPHFEAGLVYIGGPRGIQASACKGKKAPEGVLRAKLMS